MMLVYGGAVLKVYKDLRFLSRSDTQYLKFRTCEVGVRIMKV